MKFIQIIQFENVGKWWFTSGLPEDNYGKTIGTLCGFTCEKNMGRTIGKAWDNDDFPWDFMEFILSLFLWPFLIAM